MLLFAAMSAIWGIPYLLIRVAVRELSPPDLVFFRTAPAALLLLPIAAHRRALGPLLAQWRWIVAYTVIELAVPWLFLSSAEQHLASSTSGLLVAGTPLVAAVVYPLVTRTAHLDRRRMAGLLVGFAGVAALVGLDLRGTDFASVAEVGVTVIGYACGPLIISRRLSALPSFGVVSASLTLAALGYAPIALTHLPRHVSTEVVSSVAVLAVVCTAMAFVLFFELIREIGPARSVVITYLNPAVAVLLGCTVLAEPFTVGIAVGFPLILLGSVLATGGTRSDPLPPRSTSVINGARRPRSSALPRCRPGAARRPPRR
jgi:drug/metabolite transporter (DMT)-like permease